jgi:hypothetical protein
MTGGRSRKIRVSPKWDEIKARKQGEFHMLYSYTKRMLRHVEFKVEQMAARYKADMEEGKGKDS